MLLLLLMLLLMLQLIMLRKLLTILLLMLLLLMLLASPGALISAAALSPWVSVCHQFLGMHGVYLWLGTDFCTFILQPVFWFIYVPSIMLMKQLYQANCDIMIVGPVRCWMKSKECKSWRHSTVLQVRYSPDIRILSSFIPQTKKAVQRNLNPHFYSLTACFYTTLIYLSHKHKTIHTPGKESLGKLWGPVPCLKTLRHVACRDWESNQQSSDKQQSWWSLQVSEEDGRKVMPHSRESNWNWLV